MSSVASDFAAEMLPVARANLEANKRSMPWIFLVGWDVFLRILPWLIEMLVITMMNRMGRMTITEFMRMQSNHTAAHPIGAPMPAFYMDKE